MGSKNSKERTNRSNNQTRSSRLTVSSSNSTLGGKSLGGSNDTLKAAGSMSEFSQHSGDPELEFDLYDCDLNNASAVPGSFFAPTYSWDCDFDDVTPTGEEVEFELADFFPGIRSLKILNIFQIDSPLFGILLTLTFKLKDIKISLRIKTAT